MSSSFAKWFPSSRAGWAAVVSLLGFVVATLADATALRFLFGILAVLFLLFPLWRGLAPWRNRLLWRLRNRLLVAYVLIGFVPVVLLVLIGLIAAWTVYSKMAVYLVTDRLERLQVELQDLASELTTSLRVAAAWEGRLHPELITRISAVHTAAVRERLPGAEIHLLGVPGNAPNPMPGWLTGQRLTGVLMGEGAELVSTQPVRVGADSVTAVLVYRLDARVLPYLGREFARVSLRLLREESDGSAAAGQRLFGVGDRTYSILRDIEDRQPLPPPMAWWDAELVLVASQPTFERATGRAGPPLVIMGNSRVALVHTQLSYRLGEFSGIPFTVFTAFAILFLLLELVALRMGARLTRTITAAVNHLQIATEQVQAGNFSHRIQIRGRDQLSGLGEAFNSMTASIERLIVEAAERQGLQGELEIARQVQEQLFPRGTPHLKTLQLFGICRPARVVSGDYYDYGLLGPGKLLFAIGDISGKGISAALLMATIQAAVRSQGMVLRLADAGAHLSTADLVTQLNRQLYETTSSEKYASLFCGFYDEEDRTLTYTNAGHLPPVVLANGRLERLEAGGPVVGLFADARYAEACVQLPPGTLLVAFTDGLTEAENAYGEEISTERLLRWVQAHAEDSPSVLAEAVLEEIRQWTGLGEPADDMTLLIARAL